MISEGGKDRDVGECLEELLDCFAHYAQVSIFALVPNVVRRKISRPDDVVDVLVFVNDVLEHVIDEDLRRIATSVTAPSKIPLSG